MTPTFSSTKFSGLAQPTSAKYWPIKQILRENFVKTKNTTINNLSRCLKQSQCKRAVVLQCSSFDLHQSQRHLVSFKQTVVRHDSLLTQSVVNVVHVHTPDIQQQ